MSDKSYGVSSMRNEISIVAGPREWGDTRESWLARVTRKVPSVPFRTVKALFYGEIRNPNHWAAREIKREADTIRARTEAIAAAAQFRTIAAGLHAIDPEMHGQSITQYLDMAREISRQVGE
jgi:hypothetical protein